MIKKTLYLSLILFFTQSKKESKVLLAKSHALKKEPIGIVSKSKCRKLILVGTLFIVFIVGLVVSQWGTTYTLYINNTFPSLGIHAVSILFIMNTVLIVVFQSPVLNYFYKSVLVSFCLFKFISR